MSPPFSRIFLFRSQNSSSARGFGWLAFAGLTAWDLDDHHRTVTQNLPVMRGLLSGYFAELENQLLNDPQCGIFQTLGTVRQTIAGRFIHLGAVAGGIHPAHIVDQKENHIQRCRRFCRAKSDGGAKDDSGE